MLKSLLKPEYLFQPRFLFKRLFSSKVADQDVFADFRLPWGLPIRVRPSEEHGRMLFTLGVIDLVVSEFLWRLCEPGETQIDVGGNIGYMTSILGIRTQLRDGGRVIVFEANPEVFEELVFNVNRWQQVIPGLDIDPLNLAASSFSGSMKLEMPDGYESNRGLSRIASLESTGFIVDVNSQTLDNVIGNESVGVLKLDVEGHELEVLDGARELFSRGRVRDCIFEEHNEYPTPVTDFFENHGYTVMRLHRSILGPRLLCADSSVNRVAWHPTNFLATLDYERVKKLAYPRGWKVLQKSHLPLANNIT